MEQWARTDLDGLPLIVNPGRTIAIGVLLGDHKTGWVGPYHPRSRRPVGEKKVKLISQNEKQLALFSTPVTADEVDLETEDLTNCRTWFFVTHRRVRGNKIMVSSELSLASRVTSSGYVAYWSHRIPFPNQSFDGVIAHTPGDDEGPDGFEVAVDEK
jgi:hypothetical protein